jgi:DNA polymerase III delta subunit
MEVCALKYDFIASKLMAAAKGFSVAQLKYAVALCAETDYRMKCSGGDSRELLKETVLRIAAGESHAQR